jgi:sulfite exporter TauE/SafE
VIAIASGLLAGIIHVVSGPDHLAAIAPLALANWRKALAIGFRWGIGHSSGVLFVGLLALLGREFLPIESLSAGAERLVGVLLIAIGIWGFKRAVRTHLHAHEHEHDGSAHVHFHAHSHGHAPEPVAEQKPHQHTHTAFAVGTVHGIAGGSHFLGVLPALVFPSRVQSIFYLCAFGVGTVLGMLVFSYVIGALGKRSQGNALQFRRLAAAASGAAIVLGCYWTIS